MWTSHLSYYLKNQFCTAKVEKGSKTTGEKNQYFIINNLLSKSRTAKTLNLLFNKIFAVIKVIIYLIDG